MLEASLLLSGISYFKPELRGGGGSAGQRRTDSTLTHLLTIGPGDRHGYLFRKDDEHASADLSGLFFFILFFCEHFGFGFHFPCFPHNSNA